jgi:hypothetical protein
MEAVVLPPGAAMSVAAPPACLARRGRNRAGGGGSTTDISLMNRECHGSAEVTQSDGSPRLDSNQRPAD